MESSNESIAQGKKHNGWLFSHLFANLFLTHRINEINAALDFNSIQLENNKQLEKKYFPFNIFLLKGQYKLIKRINKYNLQNFSTNILEQLVHNLLV